MGQAVNLRYESSNPSLGAIGINIMNCEKCNSPLKQYNYNHINDNIFICNCKPTKYLSVCSGYFVSNKRIKNDFKICLDPKCLMGCKASVKIELEFINDLSYIRDCLNKVYENMLFFIERNKNVLES